MPIVFQINSSCNRGSTGRISEMIGLAAKKRGYDCYMAYGRYYQPSDLKIIKVGNLFTLGLHLLGSRLLDNHGLMSVSSTKHLVKQIKEINPDIIHLHNIHGYFINYKILFEYLASTNIQVVWTLHDCWLFTGHCSHFVTVGCEKWKTQCYDCPLIKDYPKSFMDRSSRNYRLKKELFTTLIDRLTLVPVSNWLAGYVKDSFLKGANIHTIHNGINTDIFKYTNKVYQGLPKGKKIVLAVSGVWTSKKGLNDIEQLSKILDGSFQIVVVGLTSKQIKSFPSTIMGIEHTESLEELVVLYSSADVYINPTWEDNFPTTNLEALACGTPVITYRTGGSVEAVTPETGSIVEQGDVNSLKKEIERICSLERDDLRVLCRKRAVEEFEMTDRYEEYVDIYDSLLNR